VAAMIRKAIIKSYDPEAHKATVQIAGSLGVWLDGIRVATDIPAADVVAGRQCTVLFLDPSNQDDAVVITIQGAMPSGGGGGATTFTALTDTPTSYSGAALRLPRVNSGETALEFHDPYAAAHAWAALQTFNAGIKLAASQQIQDSGGTGRILLATAAPHVTLTGTSRVGGIDLASGVIGSGDFTAGYLNALKMGANYMGFPIAGYLQDRTGTARVTISENAPYTKVLNECELSGSIAGSGTGLTIAHTLPANASSTVLGYGVPGATITANSKTVTLLRAGANVGAGAGVTGLNLWGLNFEALTGGSGAYSEVVAQRTTLLAGSGPSIADMAFFRARMQTAAWTGSIAALHGLHIMDIPVAGTTTAYGIKVDDFSLGTNKHLAWLGGATPNLRVDAGSPAANLSQAWLAVNNGAVVARQIQIGPADSAGAGYRYLRVLN
jgi:hypothetical protein